MVFVVVVVSFHSQYAGVDKTMYSGSTSKFTVDVIKHTVEDNTSGE